MKTPPSTSEQNPVKPDDRVLPVTRWLGILVIPFLVAAFIILYLLPSQAGRLFAWNIQPQMTAMMLAAAYMGGIYFFFRVATASQWHRVKAGFLPVVAFTSLLSIATVLHWDRFNHGHISFFTWTFLYFTTPFLVFGIWLFNRRHDPRTPEPGDPMIPTAIRVIIAGIGIITLVISLLLVSTPALMITLWPWKLTPLTARVASSMFALPAIVGLEIASDRRWSAAGYILQAQALSIFFILLAGVFSWTNFAPANPGTWLFFAGLAAMLVGILVFYAWMESRRKRLAG
jgi:hypothetical protein